MTLMTWPKVLVPAYASEVIVDTPYKRGMSPRGMQQLVIVQVVDVDHSSAAMADQREKCVPALAWHAV